MCGAGLSANMGCMQITDILKKLAGPAQSVPADSGVTLRYAGDADAEALAVLAALDSSRAPRGTVIVAEAGGELWAALSLDDGHAVANPFRPSGELSFRLAERARELDREARRKPRRARTLRPPLAPVGGTQ
jgi:hypothetical protein